MAGAFVYAKTYSLKSDSVFNTWLTIPPRKAMQVPAAGLS
jgi:hypothetical protein